MKDVDISLFSYSGLFKGGGARARRPLYFWQNLVKSAHFPPIWPRHPLFSANLASVPPLSENGSAPELAAKYLASNRDYLCTFMQNSMQLVSHLFGPDLYLAVHKIYLSRLCKKEK